MTTTNDVKLPELPEGGVKIPGTSLSVGWDSYQMHSYAKQYGALCYEAGLAAGLKQSLAQPAQATAPEGRKLVREALEYSLKVQNFAQRVHTARQDRDLAAMEPILRKLTEDALKQLP